VIIYVKTTKKVISGDDGIVKDCMNIIYSGM